MDFGVDPWPEVVLWVLSVLISGFVGLFLDIILPSKYRRRLCLYRRKLHKICRNPSYVVGMDSRLDFRNKIAFDEYRSCLKRIFGDEDDFHFKGERSGEILFDNEKGGKIIHNRIYPHCNIINGEIYVRSLNVMVRSTLKYRDLQDHVLDIQSVLNMSQGKIIGSLNSYSTAPSLYVKTKDIDNFDLSGTLNKFNASEISGSVADTDTSFVYYSNKLRVNGYLDSHTLNWFKDVISYIA